MAKLSYLASVGETRKVLDTHGLATKHSLGQNFLVNDAVLQKIVKLADLSQDDFVLEIGPGIGTLSVALLQSASSLVSIERDADLPAVLNETLAPWAEKFALIEDDALAVKDNTLRNVAKHLPTKRDFPNKLIANLPYAVAATLVLDYFERFPEIESMTVMVQREVADRMAAIPCTKDYAAYSVKLQLRAKVVGRFIVGPNNFFPPPRVDSAVIRLDRAFRSGEDGSLLSEKELNAAALMADAAFATRRKTLNNSFKTFFGSRGENGKRVISALPTLFQSAFVDQSKRGEALTLEDYVRLGKAYLCLGFDV
jgi:16S rRNA (adenine1518-N6/adenine1519-N6)-dimethyltransferase